MITYNFRHRGAYEYDKFVLNFMQLHNLVLDLKNDLQDDSSDLKDNLQTELNEIYDSLTGENSLSSSTLKLLYYLE